MGKLLSAAALSAAVLIGSNTALGHEEFRVIGTLTSRAETIIEVASRDGATRSIKVDRQTVITRDAGPVDVNVLEAGMTLVIDAYGDSLDDLLALEIRIVPPIEQ
jgi:hypothetical protein